MAYMYKINIFLYVLYFLEVMPFCLFQTWLCRPSVYLTPPPYISLAFNIKLGFLFITIERHISFHYKHVPKITPVLELMLEGLFFGTWHLIDKIHVQYYKTQSSFSTKILLINHILWPCRLHNYC